MGEKIKGNNNLIIWLLVITVLIYTRFVNLTWGLPHPMHPDERNMAVAVMQLECKIPKIEYDLPKTLMGEWKSVNTWLKVTGEFKIDECFNPHFFAYGQLPLYLGYALVFVIKLIDGGLKFPIGLNEATLSLRLISAIASVLTAVMIIKIVKTIRSNNTGKGRKKVDPLSLLIISGIVIFAPYAIQFSHFGTTESLLMFFYSLITYLSLLLIERKTSLLFYVLNTSFHSPLSDSVKVFPPASAHFIARVSGALPTLPPARRLLLTLLLIMIFLTISRGGIIAFVITLLLVFRKKLSTNH